MPAYLKFTGVKELEAALKELGTEVAGKLGDNAVRASAREIAAQARQTASFVDRTGRLRRSIRVLGQIDRRAGERTAYAGTRLFYGRFLEFGTAHIPARSWLRKAVDEGGQAALDKMVANLRAGIARVVAKRVGKG